MNLDAFLKRFFPGVICALLAVAAYFQASGMGQLVAESIAAGAPVESAKAVVAVHKSVPAANATPTEHTTSADAIIERNPFDSVTGPLNGKPVEIETPTPEAPPNTDPYQDPQCDVGRVLLITQSDDPAWSFAAIAGGDGKSTLRRQGDDFSGHKIEYIGWDRVWLTSGSTRCQMQVGGTQAVSGRPAAAAPPPSTESSSTKKNSRKVPQEIASKIHKISDTEFNVDRSAVDAILENQAELMRSARIVPEKEGDKVVGIKLFGIRGDSLLGTLGLENGDRLQTINGFEMSDPQKALEAYARLRSADHLTVTVNRRGKPVNLDFNIK